MSLKEQVIYSDSYLANPHYEFNHVILDMPPKRYEAKVVGESRDSVDSQSYLLENSHQKSNTRFLSACPFLCLHFMGFFCGRKSTSCEQERSRLGKKEQPLITNQQEKILLRGKPDGKEKSRIMATTNEQIHDLHEDRSKSKKLINGDDYYTVDLETTETSYA